jgi:hypothetical protein
VDDKVDESYVFKFVHASSTYIEEDFVPKKNLKEVNLKDSALKDV